MNTTENPTRNSFSLSSRISFFVIMVAIIPLFITVVVSEWQLQTNLRNQGQRTLTTDAQTHAQLLDSYFNSELLAVKGLNNTPLVQQYLANPAEDPASVQQLVQSGLAISKVNDPNQLLATYFDTHGNYLLSYSLYHLKTQYHGKYLIPPEVLQHVVTSKTQQYISSIYTIPTLHTSAVDLYTTVFSNDQHFLGIVCNTLSLHYISAIIDEEHDANGTGSYAFLLDDFGVRIIDPNQQTLFTSIAPLSSQQQQIIKNENRYGKSNGVSTLTDTALSNAQKQHSTTFTDNSIGQNASFQVARYTLSALPWTYFVLTPTDTIVALANQQALLILFIALLVLIPAAITGWLVGKRISAPIAQSVNTLLRRSTSLKQLSELAERTASQQIWIVESSEAGFKLIQYYTHASKVAAHHMNEIGTTVVQDAEQKPQMLLSSMKRMLQLVQYYDKALQHQEASNTKMASAVKVINEITTQIAQSATSTNEAAQEMDDVVLQLRHILGE